MSGDRTGGPTESDVSYCRPRSDRPATDSQRVAAPSTFAVAAVIPNPDIPPAPNRGRADGLFAWPVTWLGVAVLLAGVEFVTPSTLLVPIFFPVPSLLAAWHRRRWWTAALVVGMTAVALRYELATADTWGLGPPWANAAVRLFAYSVFALMTAHAARLRDQLTDPAAAPSHPRRPFPAALGSPVVWAALAVVLAAADFLSGPEVLVSVLFVIPVLLAGWHRRLGWAAAIAAGLVLGRLVLELTSRGAWLPWANLLNAAFRLLMLGAAAYVADLAAFLTLEAADRVGDAEGHSVEFALDPAALRSATPVGGPAAVGPRAPRRTRFAVVYEAVAAAVIGLTLAWDIVMSMAVLKRTEPERGPSPADRRE